MSSVSQGGTQHEMCSSPAGTQLILLRLVLSCSWTELQLTRLQCNIMQKISYRDNLKSYQEVCNENVVRDISYRRYIHTFYCILLQIYVQTILNCRMVSNRSTLTSGFSISDSPFLYFPQFPSSSLTIVFIWQLVVITFSSDKIFGLSALRGDIQCCVH